jgi:uncharacterized OB-fold protein
MAQTRPNRVLGPGHDDFWDHCSRKELRIQRCRNCRHLSWPPVENACERCQSSDLTWEKLSGEGKIISWCTFERRYYGDTLPIPWDAILVELDEGPLFISNPQGFENADISQNQRVKVTFIDCKDQAGPFRLPVFELDAAKRG